MQESYEADEIFCQVDSTVISKDEIMADFDFWFSMLSQLPNSFNANELGIEARRTAKISEVSNECENTIISGIDVELNGENSISALQFTTRSISLVNRLRFPQEQNSANIIKMVTLASSIQRMK